MKQFRRILTACLVAAVAVLVLPGCEKETTGDKVDDAIEDATDAAEDAKEDAKDAADDAKKKLDGDK